MDHQGLRPRSMARAAARCALGRPPCGPRAQETGVWRWASRGRRWRSTHGWIERARQRIAGAVLCSRRSRAAAAWNLATAGQLRQGEDGAAADPGVGRKAWARGTRVLLERTGVGELEDDVVRAREARMAGANSSGLPVARTERAGERGRREGRGRERQGCSLLLQR